MKPYSLYVFDLDGVLYRGNEIIPGAVETVRSLQQSGKLVRYLTNNSSETRDTRARILLEMSFQAAPDQIYTSAFGAAEKLGDSTVFVVGEDGLREELRGGGAHLVEQNDPSEWVVVGICWSFNYAMLDEAQRRIRDGAKFIATNRDNTFPDAGGRIKPGAGAIVASIAAAAGKEPDVVIGKPEPYLLESILRDTEVAPSECLVIGDRVDTDILCANRAGCDSALVLTGVTNRAPHPEAEPKPTVILNSVADLWPKQPTATDLRSSIG